MAEFTWKILRVSWDESTGAVVKAMWHLTAEENGYQGYVKGEADFSPDPEAENFIPLEDLTEETVLSWVKKTVKNREGLEKLAIERLEKRRIPSTIRGLPWANL